MSVASRMLPYVCALVVPLHGAPSAKAQQVVGSVEAGLHVIAEALLAGSSGERRPSFSVLPFPGADQSCPLLSVYVVDELTTTLITAVKPRPRIVERQQLEAIIAQNQLDGFLTDPEQRRRLGGLSGIDAVVLGTFAAIGDRVRINARLVAIDTGETISAAAVSVPRTNEIVEMLRQGSNRGRNCLTDGAPRARAAAAPGVAPPNAERQPARPSQPGEPCEGKEGVQVCVRSLRVNGETAQLTLDVENTGSSPIGIGAVGPAPDLVDNDGVDFALQQISGVPICDPSREGIKSQYFTARYQSGCLSAGSSWFKRSQFRHVPAGGRASVLLQFRADRPFEGKAFTVTAAFALLPRAPASMAVSEAEKMDAQPLIVVISDVRPTQSAR